MSADEIVPRLWMGSHPPEPIHADLWVLAAKELQEPTEGTTSDVLQVPLTDDGATLSRQEARAAERAAREVAQSLRDGETVLVTCAEGRNRSGLIVGLALCELFKIPGSEAVELVRLRRRARALTNPAFVRYLRSTH